MDVKNRPIFNLIKPWPNFDTNIWYNIQTNAIIIHTPENESCNNYKYKLTLNVYIYNLTSTEISFSPKNNGIVKLVIINKF